MFEPFFTSRSLPIPATALPAHWAWLLNMAMLLAAGAFVLLNVTACAAQRTAPPAQVRTTPLPWWVASPSAPLPQGFPSPGPLGEVIVKEYPAYRTAVARPEGAGPGSADRLFFPLFSHIEQHQIAMSSPVEMRYSALAGEDHATPAMSSMAFIYGDARIGATGADGPVQVIDVPPMAVASTGVAGSYTDARFQAAYAQLKAWLKDHQNEYAADGPPRYLAYNSPFVLPFMRYGEVQVPIRRLIK